MLIGLGGDENRLMPSKPYETPAIIDFGPVHELTLAGSFTGSPDSSFDGFPIAGREMSPVPGIDPA